MTQRLSDRFTALKQKNQAAFVPFIMAGDPDLETCLALLEQLPDAGADVIELGMPFSDPMADGPVIEAAGQRALANKVNLPKIFALIQQFRKTNTTTPIILMGYYNPVYHYDVEKFARDAVEAGVDGLILVDLPPEEEQECVPALNAASLDLIRLIAPTTNSQRQSYVTHHASGFVYYIAVKGITGSHSAPLEELEAAVKRLKQNTELPVAVGFGIRTPEQAAEIAAISDAVVVGSAIVAKLAEDGVSPTLDYIRSLAAAVKNAR